MDRRSFLRLGGAAAAAGMTSLAGCSLLDSSSQAPPTWLYDPTQLAPARNIGFATFDLGQLYSVQQELPIGPDQPDTGGQSPISPSDLEGFHALSGFSFVSNNGRPIGFGSMCLTGSFPTDRIERAASMVSIDGGQSMDRYDYTLYTMEGDTLQGTVPLDASASEPLQLQGDQSQKVVLGVGEEAVLMGTTTPRVTDAMTGRAGATIERDVRPAETVAQMIKAKQGEAKVLYSGTNNDTKYAKSIRDRFDSPTFLMGATLDPAAMTFITIGVSLALSSLDVEQVPVGDAAARIFENLFADIRGGAFGATMTADVTTAKVLLTYRYENSARSTGLVQMIEAADSYSQREGDVSLSATYEGKNVVVTIEGDTMAMLSEDQPGAGGEDGGPLA